MGKLVWGVGAGCWVLVLGAQGGGWLGVGGSSYRSLKEPKPGGQQGIRVPKPLKPQKAPSPTLTTIRTPKVPEAPTALSATEILKPPTAPKI